MVTFEAFFTWLSRVLTAFFGPLAALSLLLLRFFRHLLPACPQLLLWLALPICSLLGSCTRKYHQQRTMFQVTKGADGVVDTAKLRRVVNRTARNYRIQPNDLVGVRVYTNNGESLLDPNNYLPFSSTGGAASTPAAARPAAAGGTRSLGNTAASQASSTDYLVQADGRARLPLVGEVKLQNLTLLEADSVLKMRYDVYYKQSFVRTTVTNNRVVVLGASGGQVISLANDNMNLLEVLALAGGVDGVSGGGGGGATTGNARYGGRVDNIRIIRGDLKNPQVQFVDLSTLDGMRRANLQIEPNDIIYVQPVRRPALEALTDAAPFLNIVSLLVTIAVFVGR